MFAFLGSILGVVVAQQAKQDQEDPSHLLRRASFGSEPSSEDYPELSESDMELLQSLEFARKINSMNSINDFLNMVDDVPPSERKSFTTELAGFLTGRTTGNQRSNSVQPKPALCMPELQPVPLKQETDPSIFYYPTCTRIMRCGGCCTNELLSCQPTEVEIRNYEAIRTSFDPSEKLKYRGKTIVPLEVHTKCECDCKIKEKDCTLKQTYKKAICQCVCNNVDEREKCIKDNNTKIWNSKTCDCVCREEKECSTGFYFDQNTCRCERKE